MELEAVGRISMSNVGLEVCWQVDDVDSSEGAFLWTDTASNAKILGDESNFR
jgi:hypothetical protein